MSSEDYKELDKIKKFNFSFDMVSKSKGELQEQRDAVKERIDKIVGHFTIDDVPILSYILHVTSSRVELKKLSKALVGDFDQEIDTDIEKFFTQN